MQLAFDSADRLVELVQARRGPVPLEDAARTLFALRHVPVGPRARAARRTSSKATRGSPGAVRRSVSPTRPARGQLLEHATYVVVDLETTGLRPGSAGICEIGAVRVRGLELAETFETLVNPRRPLPAPIAALTGIEPASLRGAPPAELAVRRFLEFAGDAVLVAHNARFDLGFLDVEVERLTGRRLAAPVVDTVWLARRLLEGRISRVGLGSLAHFFGTSVRPCHRALADAQATAEILLALLGLAQERGAGTVAELVELSAPRARRLARKRSLVAGAPAGPGVYLFRDRNEQVLYVGRAREPEAAARLVLPHRAAAARRRGGARRGRAGRVAAARLRARGGARGAAAPARAAATGERARRSGPIATSTSGAAAAASSSRRRRRRSGRSRAGAWRSVPPGRSRDHEGDDIAAALPGCERACAGSRPTSASRTRPGSATG